MNVKTRYTQKIAATLLFLLMATAQSLYAASTETAAPISGEMLNNPTLFLVAFILIIMLASIIGLTKINISLSKSLASSNKKTIIALLFAFISLGASAQSTPVTSTATQIPDWAMNSNLYLFGFLFLIMVITLFILLRANMQLIKALSPKAKTASSDAEVETVKEPSFLWKFYLKMLDSVPVEKEKDVLLDHDYDGIHELDNNLPPWWKYGFYFTIVFGLVYLINYHVMGSGEVQLNEYKKELAVAAKEKEERMKASSENINEANVVLLADAESINNGKETFVKLCAACHRADAGGQVGPNLTDEYWLHGGGVKNLFTTISEGVPAKGMISWKNQLSPKQMQQVASYILTLKGSNPVGPKEPQGDKWVEETSAAVDSTAKSNTDSTSVSDKISEVK